MQILIHRYLLEGKNKKDENTLSQLKKARQRGQFFETDIRRLPSGEFYISHDPKTELTKKNDAVSHARFWKENNCRVALNVKELGYEKDLVRFVEQNGIVKNIFLFDFEIEFLGAEPQSYINGIHALNPEIELAVRVSDHNETVERALNITGSNIIWLDEFDRLWVTEDVFKKLKAAGRTVYCISPDLHSFNLEETKKRWQDFIAWGADGICTDFPLLLAQTLAKLEV